MAKTRQAKQNKTINRRRKEKAKKNTSKVSNSSKSPKKGAANDHCSHCHEQVKSRRREFSEQAWTILLLLGEINGDTVEQPICEFCYDEMRDILIDRRPEIEEQMLDVDKVEKIRKQIAKKVS